MEVIDKYIWFTPAIDELVDEYKIPQPWKENKFYRFQFTFVYSYDRSMSNVYQWEVYLRVNMATLSPATAQYYESYDCSGKFLWVDRFR